jgi:hypothetical protein
MPNEEAARLAEDWNEDLEKMEVGFSLMITFCTSDSTESKTTSRPECSPLQAVVSKVSKEKNKHCVTVD